MNDHAYADFLIRAADEFADGGWVFTGFNLPVLAARLARRLGASDFIQVLEAGSALDKDTDKLLTSTTDYFATAPVSCYRGSTADVLFTMVPRCRRVLMDAANVDLRGRTNSTAIGPWAAPKVRLPGGGGGPDAANNARHLVLLHGGSRWERLVADVGTVTTAPGPAATVRLITRWGTLRLGNEPALEECVEGSETESFASYLRQLGVDVEGARLAAPRTLAERQAAASVLSEARAAGYAVEHPGSSSGTIDQKGS